MTEQQDMFAATEWAEALGAPVPVEPKVKESPDQSRTRRQREAITSGRHPLALVFGGVVLHRDAPRPRGKEDWDLPGPRCGTCRFRAVMGHHDRSYGKCAWGAQQFTYPSGSPGVTFPRVSHGAATDVRAWWPGCRDWEPKEST